MLVQEYIGNDQTLIKSYSNEGYYIKSSDGNMYIEATDLARFILNGERKYTETDIKTPTTIIDKDEDGNQVGIRIKNSEDISSASRSLDNLKQLKINSFKANRDAEEESPIEYNGSYIDFDKDSLSRISNAIVVLDLLGEDATYDWTCADNSVITVTANDLRQIIANAANRSNNLHQHYRTLKDMVLSCQSEGSLNLITW